MDDAKPRIIESKDETIYDRQTGTVRHVVRTFFVYGTLGPFKVDIDVDKFTEFTLDQAMRDRVSAFRDHI